jgi:flagellar protein FliL
MAKALATTDAPPEAPQKKGPGLVVQIAVLLVLTLIAAGAGYFSGGMLKGESAPPSEEAAAHAPAEGGHGEKKEEGGHGEAEDPAAADMKRGVYALAPIMTNLAAPTDTWMRIEAAAVFDGEVDANMADVVQQDLLAYLRTVKLHQVEGPSGFLHMKDDLTERARIRSAGKVKSILIRTIVFE